MNLPALSQLVYPSPRVICTFGYPDPRHGSGDELTADIEFLPKPIKLDALAMMLGTPF